MCYWYAYSVCKLARTDLIKEREVGECPFRQEACLPGGGGGGGSCKIH